MAVVTFMFLFIDEEMYSVNAMHNILLRIRI